MGALNKKSSPVPIARAMAVSANGNLQLAKNDKQMY